MRAQSPTFVRELVLNEELDGEVEGDDTSDDEQATTVRDLRRVLAAYTIGYVEWPHIDGRFERVFRTMAGRYKWEWAGSEPEADDSDPLENARIARGR